MKFNQLVPVFHYGDAIGNEILMIDELAKRANFDSKIFALEVDLEYSDYCYDARQFSNYDESNSINILHYALPSPLTELFLNSKGIKILIFHNFTPSHFFQNYHKGLANMEIHAINELKVIKNKVDGVLADSEFNKKLLLSLGYNDVKILPLPIYEKLYNQKPNRFIINMFNDDFVNLLFVGRVSPNKKIEDLIKLFYFYKKYYRTKSRLIIVGKKTQFTKYYDEIIDLVKYLNLGDIYFTGHIPVDELIAYYQVSDIFVCASEHEGFCLPLIEAMYFDLPIIAKKTTAIPFVVKNSGILFNKLNLPLISEIIELIINNYDFKEKIIVNQRLALEEYKFDKFQMKFNEYFAPYLFTKSSK